MPAHEFPKLRPHPAKSLAAAVATHSGEEPPWAEIAATSNYTFLRGGSHPEELVERAAALGYKAIGVCDTNTLAGIIRSHVAAKQYGISLMVGSRIACRGTAASLPDEPVPDVLLYPATMGAYRHLCRLLTLGKRRAPKGECHLWLEDLREMHEEMHAVILPRREAFVDACSHEQLVQYAGVIAGYFGTRCRLAAALHSHADDSIMLSMRRALARTLGISLIATNDVLYHDPSRRMLQDVLSCIRNKCSIEEAGFALHANSERHLKTPRDMHRLFASCPEALEATVALADALKDFSLDQLRYEYPDEVVPEGRTPMEHLRDVTWQGALQRYARGVDPKDVPHPPDLVPPEVCRQIEHELALIGELDYARYFLTVHDLVVFARSRGILCQGRGAAANSAVCFCLGVTAVDPARVSVLFERFVSRERNEPPDIDIDFEHERREEVIQYIYAKYGRERAALTGVVISYRRRSAVRDVGKALGLSLDLVDRLAKDIEWWDEGALKPASVRKFGLNPSDPTLKHLARLVAEILSFPRHLSQHPGGFVITRTPLCELVPIENASMPDRTVIEWDKDDVDAAGMLKVDVLGLGMLSCVRKCLQMVRPPGMTCPDMAVLPAEDPAVYDMICNADTVGVFQIESRAQMSMLPRLRPRNYYDLVIEVAIVRPGPIQGDMVHPYLRRRNGEEPVIFPDEKVREVLGRTLGIPLFQEQCMALAVACAGFTPGEADQLRRAMAAWKRKGDVIFRFGKKIIEGMTARGYDPRFAQQVFDQIKGFSEYGFPESHAASFAHIVYASAYLKKYHPAAFAAALINSQPMGFYAPAQIIRDAQVHGVTVRPVDVARSDWDCTLEPDASSAGGVALRMGMRMVRGLREEQARKIGDSIGARGVPRTIKDLWRRSDVLVASLRSLAAADAFGSMGLTRQQAQWKLRSLRDESLPLFDGLEASQAPTLPRLPGIGAEVNVVRDYASIGLSLKAHPVSFLREQLAQKGVSICSYLVTAPTKSKIAVAGIVLVRQRPGTAKGVTFVTLEDESGIANLIVRPKVYEKYRRAARHGVIVLAHGRVERQGQVVHVLVTRLQALDGDMTSLVTQQRNFH
jgi:error-prone DNA polymerase